MQSQAGITSNERDCTLGGGGGVILGRPQHFGVGNLCCHVLLIKKRNVAFEKRKNEKEHPVLPTKPYKGPGAGGGGRCLGAFPAKQSGSTLRAPYSPCPL